VVAIGMGLTIAYYALILLGPLDYPLLRRYCLSHWVCQITVFLFSLACVSLTVKALELRRQQHWARRGAVDLEDMLIASTEPVGRDVVGWLSTLWQSQSSALRHSWLGERVTELMARQQKRGNTSQIDEDIRELASRDVDRQYDSHGLVRIATWAMPMLGFLGTVLGISETLGQMDTQSLASGSQEAMNRLTGGLYIAFDTTAIALVLTVAAMFYQFVVQRSESGLLHAIDRCIEHHLLPWFAKEELPSPQRSMDELVERIASQVGTALLTVVEKQAELWCETISQVHEKWQRLSTEVGSSIEESLTTALDRSLGRQIELLSQVSAESATELESRWQQWQTTLSEQTRLLLAHQKEMSEQTALLNSLIEKGVDLERMDEALDRNLLRLTDIDRFHEAAVCMTEAVAFLGTQMERHGILGKKAHRRPFQVFRADEDAAATETGAVTHSIEDADTVALQAMRANKKRRTA
jgi:biopolymer transport protein ExbB/TolQ